MSDFFQPGCYYLETYPGKHWGLFKIYKITPTGFQYGTDRMFMEIEYLAYKNLVRFGSLPVEGVHTRIVPGLPSPTLDPASNFKKVPREELPLYLDGTVFPAFERELGGV